MNQIKTQEYKAIHDKLQRLLLDDLAETLPKRQAEATERHKANQKAFLESFGKDINLSIEGLK